MLVFDADFGLANVEVMFGAIPKYNLADVIYHGKQITEIISEGPMGIGLSRGTGVTGLGNLTDEQISLSASLFRGTGSDGRCDSGGHRRGIANHVLEFVLASPEVLVVTTPEPTSLTDSYSLLKSLYRNPKFDREYTKISVLSNRVISAAEGRGVYDKLNTVVGQF